jgi:penicillin-binding protein 1A
MAGVVLASLTEQGHKPVGLPTLVKGYDFTSRAGGAESVTKTAIVPNRLIRSEARPLVRTLLQAPLCYTHGGARHGTLKGLSAWCPDKANELRLHFAKTGTSVSLDVNATVDSWIAGGLQFANGAAYSYVVLVGTGNPSQPWARSLHAAQVGVPLLETLLADLREHAKKNPGPVAAAPRPSVPATRAATGVPSWRERVFQVN